MVLRRHENQSRSCFRRPLLRRSPASLQDADDCAVSRQNANPDRQYYGETKNQRHVERNHDQTTLLRSRNQMLPYQFSSTQFLQSICVGVRR
jgi:hypothetical protein